MRAIDADELRIAIIRLRGNISLEQFERYIKTFPIVDVEPVKYGNWQRIDKQHIQEWQMMSKCSVCGHAVTNSCYVDRVVYFKFCPYCGAKMGGAE